MHYMLPSARNARAACLFASAALTTAMLFMPTLARAQRGGAAQPSLVQVAPVVQRNLAAGYTFTGTVHPARRAVLGSAVDGRLVAIIDDGLWVERRQPIARLRTNTIEIEIAGAKAEEELRRHEKEEVDEGSRQEEIDVAKSKFESAAALFEYAKRRHERAEKLFGGGQAASREEVEQTLSAKEAAEKAKAAAESEYKLAKDGPRAEKKLQAADRLLMQQQVVRQLEDRRKKYDIRTHFSGYVTTKYAEVGAWVKQGDPLVEVIELDPAEINVSIPEAHIAKVKPGMDVQVRIDAVSARDSWPGKVVRIVPQADLRSRTFLVKVQLRNPEETPAAGEATTPAKQDLDPAPVPVPAAPEKEDAAAADDDGEVPEEEVTIPGQLKLHTFKSGMLANCSLRLGAKQDALLVHKDALVLGGATLDGQPTYTVYVVKPGPDGTSQIAAPVSVAIGMYDGEWVEVAGRAAGSIKKGDLVVTVGNERLQPNQPIRYTPPK